MITQYVADLPEGKTIPDFQCKPAAVTIQEGKVAVFKATVNGDPKPDVSWRRAKGTISNKDKFQSKYDDSTGEYILEIRNVSVDDTDTYKCCAVNEYGKAVCPTTLTVNEAKPSDFRKLLRKSKTERGGGETDERFWEVMLKADRKDYERICSDFGVVDLHLALKKVEEKKREKKQKRSKDDAIPLNEDREKQTVQNIGRIKDFGVKGQMLTSTELNHVNLEKVNVLNLTDTEEDHFHPTEFEISKVEFVIKIQEIKVQEGDNALFECVLTHPLPRITWMGKGIVLKAGEKYGITVTDHKLIHRLLIRDCQQLDKGIYSAVAGITSCSAWLVVEDPGVHFICGLSDVNAIMDQTAELSCKLSSEECEGAWFKDGKKISPDDHFTITKDGAIHKMVIIKCTEEHSGKYRFEADGRKTEAMVNVKDPPRFDPENLQTFCDPVTVKVGHNAIFKLHFVGHEPITIQWYREGEELHDDSITRIEKSTSHSRLLLSRCQRKDTGEIKIKLKNQHGFTEETSQLIVLAFPGPPAPPKVISTSDDCINLSWDSPSKTGGSRILGYILEKRKKGSNLWKVVNAMDELIKGKYAVKDVMAGMAYEFRLTAINLSGAGEFSNASEFVFARDPKKPPGKVTGLKVTETSYTHLVLTWNKPKEKLGIQDEANGYFVEIRQADCIDWSRCNTSPVIMTSYNVKGLKSMDMYWVRVIATNDGGESAPEELANYVLAMPSPVRPKFTNHTMKSFMVVRAGNSVRITVNFEASPVPDIMWLKDNVPVTRRATVSNSDGSSQLLITSSERYDSGIYSVLVKNLVGQETFSTEVRVTDDPKPPGPVELEENVPGTVTVIWEPSPDEKRDDRLHYTVSKLDSTKRAWTTVADRLFNNKFTVCNIMQGREYHFRIYAKNDIGISAPSESPTWGIEKKKEKFVVNVPSGKDCDLLCAPTFIVPLKLHTAPKGYECYMSCAVKGNPKPRITWYRNHVSLNTNTNYYISNTCGVCSMLILRVGTKDMGEYSITAENALGRAECSTALSVRE
ncbi:immunoglobulin-like and fibronectin type III domain-containing protein 1 [Echeneis naucrates]|uniref:immunoglobulin-like and fibronectin type III domain-containing protein 1 n=1 Tax=Echeneis naucrates TaxID=173247 RepID=UPI001113B59E|nr:immunoglobulin-like and fibronectin type III domain-containing protein 1 [Echeneis naucrates]